MKLWLWRGEPEQRTLREFLARRRGWFLHDLTPAKAVNLAKCASEYLLRREVLGGWPILLKIDVSPLCNLRCPTCVHGDPRGNPELGSQRFRPGQLMRPEQLERIVSEVRGTSMAVQLFYLGDPFMHPDIIELCQIAHVGRLNVHLCTSFSFPLSDERLRSLVTSGVTHLTICVDGMTQETYERTRVGGRIDWVLSNLERVCAFRREAGRAYPQVEVQFVMFRHNRHELEAACRRFERIGVDQATVFWGFLHNYTDCDPGTYDVYGPRQDRRLPRCYWPYFFMVIKYNGDAIPCCLHRVGEQYSEKAEQRTLGNVFETGVRDVWNSSAYRAVRRLVLSPAAIRAEETLRRSFCNECPRLFDTNCDANLRSAQHYSFEDLYIAEGGGITRRLRTS